MAKSMGSLVLALLIVVMLMGLASHYGSAARKHIWTLGVGLHVYDIIKARFTMYITPSIASVT